MDNISADHVQTADDEVNKVTVDCLSNPVVVMKILENFSSRQLLKLSVVNKLWKYVARTLMKKRGNLFASIGCSHDRPCEQVLEAFAANSPKMDAINFSGLWICIYCCMHPDEECSANDDEAMDHTLDAILELLSLKKASFQVFGDWGNYEYCPALMLIEKVLHHFSADLEELTFNIDEGRECLIEAVAEDCIFPRLGILKLEYLDGSSEDYSSYIKALVSRAPNLKELHIDGEIHLKENLMEGSSAVLVYKALACAPFNNISENAISALRLKVMKMYYRHHDFSLERFYRFTPMLLQASCTETLDELWLDAVLAVPLMWFGVCLENVKYLDIYINYGQLERLEPRILSLVKKFDFTRIFPSLKKVNISCDSRRHSLPADMNAFVERASIFDMREPMPDRAVNIKKLRFDGSFPSISVQFFAEMFPTIEKLCIRDGKQILFGSIWKHCVSLKKLEARGKIADKNGNLDSIFCGIFPEEVAELRQKDEDYLKRVNIVPVMPAITCLRNLRTFTFDYKDDRYRANGDPMFILSKVSGLIAFGRCPDLAVTLKTSHAAVYEALKHMEPYASVALGR